MKTMLLLLVVGTLAAPGTIFIITEEPGIVNHKEQWKEDLNGNGPYSIMTASPRFIFTDSFEAALLEWRGFNGVAKSGLSHFDVQMKIDRFYDPDVDVETMVMPFWQNYLMNTTETSDSFHPTRNAIYFFRVRAVDNNGRTEDWTELWDTFVIGFDRDVEKKSDESVLDRLIDVLEYIDSQLVEIPENPEGVLDRTIDRLKQIEDARDEIQGTIKNIRENMPPVAEAGEDINEHICYKPYDYEDNREWVEQRGWKDPYPLVEFNASASYDPDGEIIQYIWDFGDGVKGYGEQTSHTYINPGEYKVTLTVVDEHWAYDKDTLVCVIDEVIF
jgi:hypothetical protein